MNKNFFLFFNFGFVASMFFFEMNGMNQTKQLEWLFEESKKIMTIKDAIKHGKLDYFKKYCDVRHSLGIEGRKKKAAEYIYLGKEYGSQLIFPNNNLLSNICDSQHKNSVVMLNLLLNKYSGSNGYVINQYGYAYILKIFDSCNTESAEKIRIALEKINIILDENNINFLKKCTLNQWITLFDKLKKITSHDSTLNMYVHALFCRFQKMFRLNNDIHVFKVCSSLEPQSTEALQEILEVYEMFFVDKNFLKANGNDLLSITLCNKNLSDQEMKIVFKKLKMLFEKGAFYPQKNDDMVKRIINKLESIRVDDIELEWKFYVLFQQAQKSYEEYILGKKIITYTEVPFVTNKDIVEFTNMYSLF